MTLSREDIQDVADAALNIGIQAAFSAPADETISKDARMIAAGQIASGIVQAALLSVHSQTDDIRKAVLSKS